MKKFEFSAKNVLFLAYIAAEAAIYITFNILSAVIPNDPIYLKYTGVLLCLAAAGASIYFFKDVDAVILTCALVYTAISDLFILVLDTHYDVGLVTFIMAQITYLYRLYKDRVKKIWITLVVRAALTAVIMGIVGGLATMNLLIVEVCIYIVMLAGNCVDAFILCRRSRQNLLFALGLLLFLCCDVCVGLDNAGSVIGLNLSSAFVNVIQYLIWVFYMPSQVLIACSVRKGGLCAVERKGEAANELQG